MDKKPYIDNFWDLNFDKSYMTKSNQKPLYKTRFMLDNVLTNQSKRDIAEKNKLNYLVFLDNDLSDFKKWLESFDLS